MDIQSPRPAATPSLAIRSASSDRSFEARDYALYAATVAAWSLSWFAIALQVGKVPNEVNLVWRFALATCVIFTWVVVARKPLRFPLVDHLRFAAIGILMFSSNFLLFYYGAGYLVSGLLSVVFSLASVINILLSALVMRARPAPRVLAGALIGFAGIALLFFPELAGHGISDGTAIGLALCVTGTVSFCLGNQILAVCLRNGLPLIPMNAWGMFYGTLWCAFLAVVAGRPFIIEPTFAYLGSLVFLAVISTVIGNAAYLALLGRVGPGRAGYTTVMFPIIALLVSTALEGYRWTGYAAAGLVFVAIGNVLVVRSGRR